MATQNEFLDSLWATVINGVMVGNKWVGATVKEMKSDSDGPFAEVGPILERMREKGISEEDICRVARLASYEACFSILCMLEDPGLDQEEIEGIHESLLQADPSGKEGRPGSWPIPEVKKQSAAKKNTKGFLLRTKKSFAFAFSPKGERIVNADRGEIWDIATGGVIVRCKVLSNTTDVEFSPDGAFIATLNTQGTIVICDAGTGEQVRKLAMKEEGSGFAYSPDGHWLASGDWEGRVFLWDARTGEGGKVLEFDNSMIQGITFRDKGRVLAITVTPKVDSDKAPCCIFWDIKKKQELQRFNIEDTEQHAYFNPADQNNAFVAGYTGMRFLNRTKRGEWVASPPMDVEEWDVGYFKDATYHPDGKTLAISGDEGFVFIEVNTWRVIQVLHRKYGNQVAFSPDGRRVALATWGPGELWDFDTLMKLPRGQEETSRKKKA